MCPRPAWCVGLASPAWCRLSGLSRPCGEPSSRWRQAGPNAVSLWGRTRGRAAATESIRRLRRRRRRGRWTGRVRGKYGETGKREGGQDGGHQLAVQTWQFDISKDFSVLKLDGNNCNCILPVWTSEYLMSYLHPCRLPEQQFFKLVYSFLTVTEVLNKMRN